MEIRHFRNGTEKRDRSDRIPGSKKERDPRKGKARGFKRILNDSHQRGPTGYIVISKGKKKWPRRVHKGL